MACGWICKTSQDQYVAALCQEVFSLRSITCWFYTSAISFFSSGMTIWTCHVFPIPFVEGRVEVDQCDLPTRLIWKRVWQSCPWQARLLIYPGICACLDSISEQISGRGCALLEKQLNAPAEPEDTGPRENARSQVVFSCFFCFFLHFHSLTERWNMQNFCSMLHSFLIGCDAAASPVAGPEPAPMDGENQLTGARGHVQQHQKGEKITTEHT